MDAERIPITGPGRWIGLVPGLAAGLVGLIGSLALVGWALELPLLRNPVPGSVSMHPVTAVGLLVAAAALALEPGRPRAALVCSAILVVGGLLRLSGHLFGYDPGLDRLLFAAKVATATPPSVIAPNTALCFVLLGTGLLVRDRGIRWGPRLAEGFILLAGVVAFVPLVGILYATHMFLGGSFHFPMAANTGLAFLVACAGALAARPDRGLMRLLGSDTSAGAGARLLLPAALAVPILIGWLMLAGERAGVFDTALGSGLMTSATVVLLHLLIWRSGSRGLTLETELRDGRALLRAVIDGISDAIFAKDREGRYTILNPEACRIIGRNAGELLGKDAVQAFGADAGARLRDDDRQTLASDRIEAFEERIPVGGVPREFESVRGPLRDGLGRVIGTFGIARDVTERRRAEGALKRYAAELEAVNAEIAAVNRELETFSYSVSHDLRAPLRAIDGFSRVLDEDYGPALDPEARRLLGVISRNAREMGRLIDDLLRFSRISRVELEFGPVDVAALVRAVVDTLRPGRPDSRAEIAIGALEPARGDAAVLRQVWANLLDNALKYSDTRAEPRIEIGSRKNGAELIYFVRDNGVGFDMAYAGKLFGVFQRLHRPEEFEGTGVGLAIVQRAVLRHGGRVWAEAAPGAGATFSFTLPIAE